MAALGETAPIRSRRFHHRRRGSVRGRRRLSNAVQLLRRPAPSGSPGVCVRSADRRITGDLRHLPERRPALVVFGALSFRSRRLRGIDRQRYAAQLLPAQRSCCARVSAAGGVAVRASARMAPDGRRLPLSCAKPASAGPASPQARCLRRRQRWRAIDQLVAARRPCRSRGRFRRQQRPPWTATART